MTPLLFSVAMDHCTEFLVTHEEGHRSCVDPACEPDPVRHPWRIACDALDEPCIDCAVAVPDRQWQAA